MKQLAFAVIFFGLILVFSHRALGADTKDDPSQFPLTIHISASAYSHGSDFANNTVEVLTATIDGKHYQLQGLTYNKHCCDGLIDPGDYHARLSKDQHKTNYESIQEFEILFPDGTTRRFGVIAQSE